VLRLSVTGSHTDTAELDHERSDFSMYQQRKLEGERKIHMISRSTKQSVNRQALMPKSLALDVKL